MDDREKANAVWRIFVRAGAAGTAVGQVFGMNEMHVSAFAWKRHYYGATRLFVEKSIIEKIDALPQCSMGLRGKLLSKNPAKSAAI